MRTHLAGRKRESYDPHRPHPYQSGHDSGIDALAPIGGANAQVSRLAGAGAYTRTVGCGVPGCGRAHDDLIHAPADE